MARASDVLRVAAGEIGYSRWKDPNTGTKYGRDYASRHGAYYGNNGVAYCAMFVTWCLRQAGVPVPGGDFAYCPYGVNNMRKLGLEVDKRAAQPGDVVFFDWDGGVSDHVGFVELNRGGWLQTIEGNVTVNGKSGGVARKARAWGNVAAVMRPKYAQAAATTTGTVNSGLTVDGWFGAKSIRRLQHVMGTPVDGVVSSQAAANRVFLPRVGSGWEFVNYPYGSAVIRAWQRKTGAGVDGIVGKQTVSATQKFLGVSVDGYAGEQTMSAWQSWLNKQQ